jgi:hypothetical protein
MTQMRRLTITTGVVFLCLVAAGLTATQNYIAKYGASGTLVDSVITDVGGNVGIGTASPDSRLRVQQGSNSKGIHLDLPSTGLTQPGLLVTYDGVESTAPLFALQSGSPKVERLRVVGNGNVGIGTSAPDAKLRINLGVDAKAFHIDAPIVGLTQPMFSLTYDGTEATAPLVVLQSGSPKVDRFRVTASGNVGVGTSAPTSKLHVAGDIKVDGNIAAKYQDVAEWVTALDSPRAGSVVVISPQALNVVQRGQHAYDPSVAGVVSPHPGITLGEKGPRKVLVAQSGRVLVMADATASPIKPGDLLVTSPIPGHAMRSEPLDVNGARFHRPGTILGKALQSLESGTGEILMLLTLQ